jgi:beta-N-acetylhexosaminidase
MARSLTRRAFVSAVTGAAALAGTACATTSQQGASATDTYTQTVTASKRVEDLLGAMSLEQKIAQMIVLAFRTWEGKDNGVTDLSAIPDLADALQKHQYGGVILLGSNIRDTEPYPRTFGNLKY